MATPTDPDDTQAVPPAVLPADSVLDLPPDPIAMPEPKREPIADATPDAIPDAMPAAMPMTPQPVIPAAPPLATVADPAPAPAAPKPPRERRPVRPLPAVNTVGPISGIFFVALFVVSFMSLNTPDGDAGDGTWRDYWEDSGNRAQGIVASITMCLAAVCFLWLVAALRRRLADAVGTDAAYGAGVAAGALMLIASLGAGLIPIGYELADVRLPDDPDMIRMVDGLYFGTVFLPLPYALAGFLIPLFFALRGSYLVPVWLEYATLVIGVVMLTGPLLFVVPHALFMLWTLAVSVTLLLRERPVA
jgi:hypothetical protein